MRRLLLPSLGAAILLAMAAPASAYTPEQLDRWHQTAAQAWPWSACNGRYQPDVVTDLGETEDGATVLGRAGIGDTDTCRYQLVDGLDDYRACIVVVHEAGHLAGLEHQDSGLMMADLSPLLPVGRYQPCVEGAPIVLKRDEALSWVEARWPMETLDCRRDEIASRQACWGRSLGGKRLRWTVWKGLAERVFGGRWK